MPAFVSPLVSAIGQICRTTPATLDATGFALLKQGARANGEGRLSPGSEVSMARAIGIDLGTENSAVAATADDSAVKRQVGLWIDHRKAVIVTLAGQHEEIRQVTSGMEKHVRYSGAAQEDSAEDQRDRRFTGHLNKYYDAVVAYLRDADAILILGPGEAKTELVGRLGGDTRRRCVVGVQTVDKMTDRQLAARVRQRFLKSERKLHE
jgi:hypothetical protein